MESIDSFGRRDEILEPNIANPRVHTDISCLKCRSSKFGTHSRSTFKLFAAFRPGTSLVMSQNTEYEVGYRTQVLLKWYGPINFEANQTYYWLIPSLEVNIVAGRHSKFNILHRTPNSYGCLCFSVSVHFTLK